MIYSIETIQLAQLQFEAESIIRRQLLGIPQDEPRAAWRALVEAKVAGGMGRVAAIQAAAHERHDLYAAQSIPLAQFRANR